MDEDERIERALRGLTFMGSRVVGHESSTWEAVEQPPKARGQHICVCGHRTTITGQQEALDEWNYHQRQAVAEGAQAVDADGKEF